MDLTPEIVFSLLKSSDPFPVDFEDAMAWWDCRTKNGNPVPKGDLKDKLEIDFCKNLDYVIFFASEISEAKKITSVTKRGGHNKEVIKLTVDCFKSMGMTVSGERGRQIRRYFLECEASLKRKLEEEKNQQQAKTKHRLVGSIVSDKILSRYPKFDDEFYELLYKKRGNGWENRDPKKRPVCVANWTNTTVYDRLYGGIGADGVKAKLNEVNPTQENGRRKDLQHWHLKPLGEFHLSNHIAAVKAIARLSPDGDWQRFLYNIKKGLPNGESLQLNLLEYADFLENSDMIEVS